MQITDQIPDAAWQTPRAPQAPTKRKPRVFRKIALGGIALGGLLTLIGAVAGSNTPPASTPGHWTATDDTFLRGLAADNFKGMPQYADCWASYVEAHYGRADFAGHLTDAILPAVDHDVNAACLDKIGS